MENRDALRYRIAPLEMTPSEFRKLGYELVERIAEFLCTLPDRPVTPNVSPQVIREALGTGSLPEEGAEARSALEEAANLLFDHSTFNGHPRFMAVITSSAAPIGALGDLLAAAVNPNVGAWFGAPIGTEIETQTVRWIAEMIGYPTGCGGLLVSGGNMGNFVGFLAARRAKAAWDVRTSGMMGKDSRQMRVYTSSETHTWIHKAADMFGLGTGAIRWIPVDEQLRMDTTALRSQIHADIEAGDVPFLVIGAAGTVSTGAVDPHKWLYAPLEAGCALVRNPEALRDAFSYHPPYYHFAEQAEPTIDYYEYGPQNSRGLRALKVWLALRQVGRTGYVEMISDDIQLAQELYRVVEARPELQAFTQGLSITTFRYVPPDLTPGSERVEAYLNQLNMEVLNRVQRSGEAVVSNAVVAGTFLLRACIVNFRTSLEDIEALPGIVLHIGKEVDAAMRPVELGGLLQDRE